MVDMTIAVVVALVAVAAGAAAGFILRGMRASQRMRQAEEKAPLIIEKAYSQQKDLILEAKDEKLRLQREAEDEARAKRAELSTLERRLLQRDEQLDQRADMLEGRATASSSSANARSTEPARRSPRPTRSRSPPSSG